MIVVGTLDARHRVARLLSWQPLQALGRISYAWYLWHWPVLLLGRVAVGSDEARYRIGWVALSLVLAAISYVLIEAPIRHQSAWLKYRRRALLGSLLLMTAGYALAAQWQLASLRRVQEGDQLRYARAHADAPPIYAMGCDDWYHSDKVHVCAFGAADAPHTAVLMGDSIAGQWFPAVAAAFDKPGWRLWVLTKSSCPMVDEPFFYVRIGRQYTECASWREHALAQVAAARLDVVLLSTVSTDDFTSSQWTDGTSKVLAAISGAAGHVFALRSTPHLPFDGSDCLAGHQWRPAWLGGAEACSTRLADAHADLVFDALRQAVARFGNASLLDLTAAICPAAVCSAQLGGMIVFRDTQHLTATYAASLAPVLEQQMQQSQLLRAVPVKVGEGGRK